jgi:8-oxo-dGTP pyrophosphatase MutT (NUDIX family)
MAIFDSENKLLLTRRASRMHIFPKAWVLPGGHIELGETLEEGVIREILEETGVKIDAKVEPEGDLI